MVARLAGVSVDELVHMLNDNDVGYDRKNMKMVYACEGLAPADIAGAQAMEIAGGSADPGEADPTDLSLAFKLHSRPGAAKKLVLDFTGYTNVNSVWSSWGATVTPPFDTDGSPSTFSDSERRTIISTWRAVAEDFASFDVSLFWWFGKEWGA